MQFANELQRQGRTKIQAVREAALLRLRPVLMTSVATVAGNFPLILVTGAGAAARNSIGIMIVAGMTFGTLFTLLVIPSIYVLIARQHAGEKQTIPRMRTKTNSGGAGSPLAIYRSPLPADHSHNNCGAHGLFRPAISARRVADIREGIPPDGPGEQPQRHQQRERPETRP